MKKSELSLAQVMLAATAISAVPPPQQLFTHQPTLLELFPEEAVSPPRIRPRHVPVPNPRAEERKRRAVAEMQARKASKRAKGAKQ